MAETEIAKPQLFPDDWTTPERMITESMSPDLKAKWLEALRSGRFMQGHYQLRTLSGKFCCLGVLCVVAGVEINNEGTMPSGTKNYDSIRKLGVPWNIEQRLIEMNDGDGGAFGQVDPAEFSEIADYIERTL